MAAKRGDELARRALLIERAKKQFPHEPLLYALDHLYVQTIRNIRAQHKVNMDTEDLEGDLMLIINERNKLIADEIDKCSDFEIIKKGEKNEKQRNKHNYITKLRAS